LPEHYSEAFSQIPRADLSRSGFARGISSSSNLFSGVSKIRLAESTFFPTSEFPKTSRIILSDLLVHFVPGIGLTSPHPHLPCSPLSEGHYGVSACLHLLTPQSTFLSRGTADRQGICRVGALADRPIWLQTRNYFTGKRCCACSATLGRSQLSQRTRHGQEAKARDQKTGSTSGNARNLDADLFLLLWIFWANGNQATELPHSRSTTSCDLSKLPAILRIGC
jgi:hypothetical protein